MKTLVASLLTVVSSALGAAGADTIPAAVVGEWAPAQAVFRNGHLEGGYALYISTNGTAAVVVEPGFLRIDFHADYCATNCVLTLRMDPKPWLQSTLTNRLTYDPTAKKLLRFYTGEELLRHQTNVPPGVMERSE